MKTFKNKSLEPIENSQASIFRPSLDNVLEVPVLTSVRVVNATQNDNGVKNKKNGLGLEVLWKGG